MMLRYSKICSKLIFSFCFVFDTQRWKLQLLSFFHTIPSSISEEEGCCCNIFYYAVNMLQTHFIEWNCTLHSQRVKLHWQGYFHPIISSILEEKYAAAIFAIRLQLYYKCAAISFSLKFLVFVLSKTKITLTELFSSNSKQ